MPVQNSSPTGNQNLDNYREQTSSKEKYDILVLPYPIWEGGGEHENHAALGSDTGDSEERIIPERDRWDGEQEKIEEDEFTKMWWWKSFYNVLTLSCIIMPSRCYHRFLLTQEDVVSDRDSTLILCLEILLSTRIGARENIQCGSWTTGDGGREMKSKTLNQISWNWSRVKMIVIDISKTPVPHLSAYQPSSPWSDSVTARLLSSTTWLFSPQVQSVCFW